MKTIKVITLSDGTAMSLNQNYDDILPGSFEIIQLNKKAMEIVDKGKMNLNLRTGLAGQETYFNENS